MSESIDVQEIPTYSFVFKIISDLPTLTQLGIALSAVTWMFGASILIYYSMKRRGIPFWKFGLPSIKEAFGFSAKEWLMLAALAATSLTFTLWGMSAQDVPISETPQDRTIIEAG